MELTYASATETFTELRRRLEDDRRSLVTRLAATNHGGYELTATHGHGETELAARDGQQTIDAAMQADANAALDAVDDALERFASGSYGTCMACGQPIPTERLLAIPEAARCIACQQRAQQER